MMDARRNGHATEVRAIAAKPSVSSSYNLHTRLPPRPASFPSLRPDSISGTSSYGWPAYRSVGRSSVAPAPRRSTGSDACTDLDNGRVSPSAGLPRPTSSGSSVFRTPADRSRRWPLQASRPKPVATDVRAGSSRLPCSWRSSMWSRGRGRTAQTGLSVPPGSHASSIARPPAAHHAWRLPRARRIHDQCALAGNQRLVVGRVVPGRDARWQQGDELLVEFESLPHLIGLDREVALGVDELSTERLEKRTSGIDRVGCLTDSDAEGKAALFAGFCRLEERVRGPVVGLGRSTGRIHLLHVDAGVFFHQVDTGAGPLDLAADTGGNAQPFVAGLAEILHRAVHLAVLLDQRLHDVVHRLEQFSMCMRPPGRHRKDVMAGVRLAFCGDRQLELVALSCDVVD